MSNTIDLAKELISKKSITPDDAGCQNLIADRLGKIGFSIEHLKYGDVDNLWATFGDSGPLFVFLGHTDVVPTGPIEEWESDPFTATDKGPLMVGRGAADMKSSVAAFVTSIEEFLEEKPSLTGRIGVLLTSDEEGPAVDGVCKVVEYLEQKGEKITWCLVGEPTSDNRVGDVIKIGRRGSISAKINVIGIQGHVAYPDKASNPIHNFSEALAELSKLNWKDKTGKFQDSILQISNLNSGTGVTNVIPGNLVLDLNVRHSPSTTADQIRHDVESIINKYPIQYEIDWVIGGKPFLTSEVNLIEAVKNSIKEVTGMDPKCTTDGGTSDGRFIAPTGSQVVELGPGNASIHKVNESVRKEDLNELNKIYKTILIKLVSNI
jgi:succinyl-diaminopimelate desuccinylase|tara:strand:- start:4024 stop:5157 length:1134 start_codon:yes stop_codon:yes gene_type:complete